MSVETNNNIKSMIGLSALESVYDPEIGLNVVDLGLIYKMNFDEEGKMLHCTMTLTTEFCPMGESITENVKNALQATYPDYSIDLQLTFDPAWNYTMISEEGRSFLGR
ncbi:MAG: metal-sulfur cluster assembly factor [Bacteroidia bacterium]|nr:metal-sulfur cluster assembly factor [Bacteroidia bacterium]